MSYLIFLKRLKVFFLRLIPVKHQGPKISLIIPFSSKDPVRKRNFKWLLHYWKHELPDAEIIVGESRGGIFCKGEALNRAVSRARGQVLVILDADAYMEGQVLEYCAEKILKHRKHHLWFVPYRHLYRLTEKITEAIIQSDPDDPLRIPSPPPPDYITNQGHNTIYGHRYGAMCMIFHRDAYDLLGCFDERFRGWGGEDIALLRALDTLYGKHKTVEADIFHLWHSFLGNDYKTRVWPGQKKANANEKLANKYFRAHRNIERMRALIDEACEHKRKKNN